jgi:hypothetical protein
MRDVVATGRAWISTVHLPDGRRALRACITSYRTTESDVSALVELLAASIG